METLLTATLFDRMGIMAVLITTRGDLIYTRFLARHVLWKNPGSRRIQDISNIIRTGSVAYLNKQMGS